MRILVLAIFLTLFNNVRAAPTAECLASFSYDGQPVTVADSIAEEICAEFIDPNDILECNTEYFGVQILDEPHLSTFQFKKGFGATISIRTSYDRDGWSLNKLQYLKSDGTLGEITTAEEGVDWHAFDTLNFATFTKDGENYIVVRYYNYGVNPHLNIYKFESCQLCNSPNDALVDGSCQTCPVDASLNTEGTACVCNTGLVLVDGSCQECPVGQTSNADETACVCDTASNFVQDEHGNCVCDSNYALINGVCQMCGFGGSPNTEGTACECDTTLNFVSDGNNGCQCNSASFFDGSCYKLLREKYHCNKDNRASIQNDEYDWGQSQVKKSDNSDPQTAEECFQRCIELNPEFSFGNANSFHFERDDAPRCFCNKNDCDVNVPYGSAESAYTYQGSHNNWNAYAILYGNDCLASDVLTTSDQAGTCVCDTDSISVDGICQTCPTNTIPNADESACVCDSSQSLYGQPFQCESRSDDCTELHDSQYPMLMSLDGVCLQLARTKDSTACGDTTTDYGTDCIYLGEDPSAGFFNYFLMNAALIEDPPQHTFTVSSDDNTLLSVRLFYHHYKFTCVEPVTNCFKWADDEYNLETAFPAEIGGELDLSGGIAGGLVQPDGASSNFQYNKEGYYNYIQLVNNAVLKIEKLDTCGDDGNLQVNSNFCQCVGGCQCDSTQHFTPDGTGVCVCDATNGYELVGTACECNLDGSFGVNGDCGICNDNSKNTVKGNELCFEFNGSPTVESIDKIQAIQNSISQVQQGTGECPLN